MIHWLRNAAIVFIAAVVLLTFGAAIYDGLVSSRVADHYAPRGQFVQVGEANMHVICQGSGSPTLVLQPGFAGGALDWLTVIE